MKVFGPGRVAVVWLTMLALACAACPGKEPEDLCEDVTCPPGEICLDGDCVPDPDIECVTGADCPNDAPVCEGGSCRGCQNDDECGGRLVCYEGVCLEALLTCSSDADCPGIERPHCEPSRDVCVECTRDGHCPALGQICDRTIGECVTPSLCDVDSDCRDPQRPRCDSTARVCVGCLGDEDCDLDAKETCDPASRSCRPFVPCRQDQDCAGRIGTPRCDPESGDCVACIDDVDCIPGSARTCDFNFFDCIGGIPCSSASDCVDEALSRCDTRIGFCVDCLESSDCEAPGSTCDLEARACRDPAPCQSSEDCSEAVPECNTTTGFCVECISSTDCNDPVATCVGGVCDRGPPVDGRPGSACDASSNCDLSTATDEYTLCWGLWDDPWKWYQGYCTAFCDSDADCPAGSACLGGICWDLCSSSIHCRPGYACQTLTDGIREANICSPACDPALAREMSCRRDSQCQLGICDVEAGHCICSPVGGPCTGLGFCDPRAFCFEETRNGQDTGFKGGYCIIFDCGEEGALPCPAGSSCYNLGETTACLPDCDPNLPGSCERAQYGCNEVLRYVLGGACYVDSDCPAEAPDCIAAPGELGTCVRWCAEHSDCDTARGHLCANIQQQIYLCADPFAIGVCFPGCAGDRDCGACLVDSDCGLGQVCLDGVCLRPCSTSAQCQGDVCVGGHCARPCEDDTDCPRGSACESGGCSAVAYRCDPVTRRCDPPCEADIDCDRSRVCDAASGRCVSPCDDDAEDCGPAGYCNLEELLCEVDCRLLDGLCTSGQYCHPRNGECHQRCGSFGDGVCDSDLRCDVMTGSCVVPCADLDKACTHATVTEDCEPGEVCYEGYCAKTCDHHDDCPDGLLCQWGYCTTCIWPRWRCQAEESGLCFNCFEELHCPTSQYCDIGGRYECITRCGGVGEGNATCPAGQICDVDAGGVCITPCVTSSDCDDPLRPNCHAASGLCGECGRDEHCTDETASRCDPESRSCVECLIHDDCQEGEYGPACHPEFLVCVACTSDEHCESNPSGARCDLDSSSCVPCLEDDDCPSPTPICDMESLSCLGCLDHGDCRGEDLCHPGIEECHPPCGEIPESRLRTGSLAGAPFVNTFVDSTGAPAGSVLFSFQDGNYAWSAQGDHQAEAAFIGFGFSLPDEAVVTGIAVSALASVDQASVPDSWEIAARILDSEGMRERRSAVLPETDSSLILGGEGDSFGEVWSPSMISSPSFGVHLEVLDTQETGAGRARVDYLGLRVFYSLPAPTDCAAFEDGEGLILYCREDNLCDVVE